MLTVLLKRHLATQLRAQLDGKVPFQTESSGGERSGGSGGDGGSGNVVSGACSGGYCSTAPVGEVPGVTMVVAAVERTAARSARDVAVGSRDSSGFHSGQTR